MEIDHNSSANFDEVCAFIINTCIMHANQLILFFLKKTCHLIRHAWQLSRKLGIPHVFLHRVIAVSPFPPLPDVLSSDALRVKGKPLPGEDGPRAGQQGRVQRQMHGPRLPSAV